MTTAEIFAKRRKNAEIGGKKNGNWISQFATSIFDSFWLERIGKIDKKMKKTISL
jgi:hypothetical protein